MLAPVARIREYGSSPDELAAELRRIAEPQHLDDYADRKADELFDLLRDIGPKLGATSSRVPIGSATSKRYFDGSLSGAAACASIEDVQSHVDKPRLAE
jgi:hypothetical protein